MPLPKVGVCGITGKMGQAIASCLSQEGALLQLHGGLSRSEPLSPHDLFLACDVIIDFTSANAFETHLAMALELKKPILVGTTGLSSAQHEALEQAAQHIPILYARNTSLGVAVLTHVVAKAAQLLAQEHPEIDLYEVHHHFKKDAPSGTAIQLAEAASMGVGQKGPISWYDPVSTPGPRPKGSVGIAALRLAMRPGEHTVHLSWGDETVSLSHVATQRSVFAHGAIKGAAWLMKQKPGLYTMAHVLGL